MPQFFKVPIKVKPHVAKYMAAEFGEVFKITYYNPISMVIYGYLQKKTVYLINKQDCSPQEMKHLTGTLMLKIPKYQHSASGIYLQDKHHVLINNYLEQYFIDAIYQHCKMPIYPAGHQLKQSIQDFLTPYNIILDEEISYKAIINSFQRKEMRKQKQNPHKNHREKPLMF